MTRIRNCTLTRPGITVDPATPCPARWLLAALGLLIAAALLLPACARDTFVDTEQARHLAALPYPESVERAPDLDILVQRDGRHIYLINRSAHRLEHVQLWLNRQYVAEVERVAIGDDNRFGLRRFINRYQEAFPTAGLLSPDRAETVTSAELFDPASGQRYRLTVMPERRDDLGER